MNRIEARESAFLEVINMIKERKQEKIDFHFQFESWKEYQPDQEDEALSDLEEKIRNIIDEDKNGFRL